MKVYLAILISLSGLAEFLAAKDLNTDQQSRKVQKETLILLNNIYQPLHDKEFVKIAETYKISENRDAYTNQEVVEDYLEYVEFEHLPKGRIFSVFYKEHLAEAIALFKILYYTKDYDAFLKTAIWARQHVNEGLFLYSYLVALVHIPTTKDIVIPPIYEINPYYFFHAEVIHKAQVEKQLQNSTSYHIKLNSSDYSILHPEESLRYYLEDVGISSYYFFYSIYYPFWMKGEEYGFKNINRGEQYYFFHQQILARYYQERISNGLGEVPFINWNVPIDTPFRPFLEYPNGLEFPTRPPNVNLEEYFYNYGQSWSLKSPYGYSYIYIQDYERRINDAIDSGYIFSRSNRKIDLYTEDGLEVLGNVIQANADSPCGRFYGALWIYASHLLGYSYQPLDKFKVAPSALEHFETALRDPVFYQIYKKLVLKFQRYYSNIPSYKKKDLVFEGVKVNSFSVSQLITYNDYFHADISNAIYFTPQELEQKNIKFEVQQRRLNSKPFTYEIRVHSDKPTRSVIKVFLGPKYDQYGRYINLTENRMNMVLKDYFVFDLVAGDNVITRNSSDSYYYGADATSFTDLYDYATGTSNEEFSKQYNYFYYPKRYILPKGSSDGIIYQFFVIVYPYRPKPISLSSKYESYFYPFADGQQFYDSYSFGYPFDRFIRFESLWEQVPNLYFHLVKIYHEDSV